ncbi:hypothetical protein Taro_035195, partial [Colocasia esculenta]|nr:hypothetical protein [Colocasia esculenta]
VLRSRSPLFLPSPFARPPLAFSLLALASVRRQRVLKSQGRRALRRMANIAGLSAATSVNPNKSYEVSPSPADSVSSLSFSPKGNYLVATSWDNQVRCWEILAGSSQAKASISHDQPVLCSTWKDDGTTVFSAGCDKQAKMWPLLSGGQPVTVAMHDAPIKEIAWIQQMNLLVTGSWDKTLKRESWSEESLVHFVRERVKDWAVYLSNCCYKSRMAESGRVAGSAPADPDPESGQTRPESGGVGLSRPGKPVPTVPWVGRCSPPRVGSPGADPTQSRPTRSGVGRLCHPCYKYWDTRQSNPVHTQQLPERCYALTVRYPLMVVGTADRNLVVFNLQSPQTEYKRIMSPLKYQTRCLAAFPDQQGF